MILNRNTAAALDKARAEHAQAQVRIGELNQQKQAALADDPDVDVLLGFDRQIVDESARLAALGSKIEVLSARLDREQAADKERRRQKAIEQIAALLPKWTEAVGKYVRWLKSGAAVKAGMVDARKEITAAWPLNEVEAPFAFLFEISRITRAAADGADPDDLAAIAGKDMADLLDCLKQPLKSEQAA